MTAALWVLLGSVATIWCSGFWLERSALKAYPELAGRDTRPMTEQDGSDWLSDALRQARLPEEEIWEDHYLHGVDLLTLLPILAAVTGLDSREATEPLVRALQRMQGEAYAQALARLYRVIRNLNEPVYVG